MTSPVVLTDKQKQAVQLFASPATHIMLYGGSRCVCGDTILDGHTETIAALAEQQKPVDIVTSYGTLRVNSPYKMGECEMLRVVFESGKEITVTPDHRFWDGSAWVYAYEVNRGTSLGVRLSSSCHRQTSSVFSPLESPLNDQHLFYRAQDYQDDCFVYRHLYDLQLLLSSIDGQESGALKYDVAERTRNYLLHSFPFLQWRESDIQNHRISELDRVYIRFCQWLSRLSSLDGLAQIVENFEFVHHVSLRTFLLSLDLYQKHLLSVLLFCLVRLSREHADNFSSLFSLPFCRGISFDTPFVGNVGYDKVLSVTETAEKSYYNVEVPLFEHYFANGILNHNSGKTFILCRAVAIRAMCAPGSRHAIFRLRFNHIKTSIILDTWPKMMRLCFPNTKWTLNKTDFYAEFPNGSQVWFAGLDDKERTEKVLGMEFATEYFNECSQIPYSSILMGLTRLAQQSNCKVDGHTDCALRLKAYYDCNPPTRSHWSYQLFTKGIDPQDRHAVNRDNYAAMQINPRDNEQNLSAEYMQILEGMPARLRVRFMDGMYADDSAGMLWRFEDIEGERCLAGLPDMQRIVVAVDPSGSRDIDNVQNDEIGIIVAGLGVDGIGYVLEDCSCKVGPATWGKIAGMAYERHSADAVVGEENYGGAMVEHTIKTYKPNIPYRKVTATRNKVVRAEPIAALAETGKIRHAGQFPELEDELCAMTTAGYINEGSPNRVDAYVWAFTELFGDIVQGKKNQNMTRRSPPNWRVGR